MPISKLLNIRRYVQARIRCKNPFSCVFCDTRVLAKDYEVHCTKNHSLNAKIQCVWCNGTKKWKFGQKEHHIDTHIAECFKKFMLKHCPPVRMAKTPETFSKFSKNNLCEALDLFGHSKLSNIHPLAYELFLITPDYPMELTYQNPNLNSAASYVQYYEAEKRNMEFYHVMIRATGMDSAIRALGLYEDDPRKSPITFLPFSCWCDGGGYNIDFFRQHRHMIAVAPKGTFFHSFWNKIRAFDRPKPTYKCKDYERIKCALHLVNTICYLSQRESNCYFWFHKEYEPIRKNHFLIFTPLLKDFRWIMALQWGGGIMELLYQNNRRLNPAKFMHLPIEFQNGKWHIKIRYLPNVPLNLVLPISKKFKPSKTPTEYFLHLNQGNTFYFVLDPDFEELDDDTWHQKQLELGNTFYYVMGEEYWTLDPYQQRYVNDVKPVWELNEELKTVITQLKKNIVELETENTELKSKATD